MYDRAGAFGEERATQTRPSSYQSPRSRAAVGAVVLLGWFFVACVLLSAVRA